MAEKNGRSGLDRITTLIVPALVIAFVLGGISLGRSDASQDKAISAIEERQNRWETSTTLALKELKEEIYREQAQRESDMKEMRAYLVEILKELKR